MSLIFFAAGATRGPAGVDASSSRERFRLVLASGVDALAAGVAAAGVTGGLVSDGPADGLAAAGAMLFEGFLGCGFGFGLSLSSRCRLRNRLLQ